jgi:hypothetical protein
MNNCRRRIEREERQPTKSGQDPYEEDTRCRGRESDSTILIMALFIRGMTEEGRRKFQKKTDRLDRGSECSLGENENRISERPSLDYKEVASFQSTYIE